MPRPVPDLENGSRQVAPTALTVKKTSEFQHDLHITGGTVPFPARHVYCVGRNFAAHPREMGFYPDREPPLFFCKPNDDASGVLVVAGAMATLTTRDSPAITTSRQGGASVRIDDGPKRNFGYAAGLGMTRCDLQVKMREH